MSTSRKIKKQKGTLFVKKYLKSSKKLIPVSNVNRELLIPVSNVNRELLTAVVADYQMKKPRIGYKQLTLRTARILIAIKQKIQHRAYM